MAGGLAALVLLAGCAEQTAKGTVVGAGSGALHRGGCREGTGRDPRGRDRWPARGPGGRDGGSQADRRGQPAAPAASPGRQPAPPPSAQWTVVSAPPPGPPVQPGPPPDPTRGVITNGTPWEIHVFIDAPPGSPGPLVLRRGDSAPAILDIGQHRIVAQAYVDTQLGRRLVGTFDQILAVDPRAPGWTIHFFPTQF